MYYAKGKKILKSLCMYLVCRKTGVLNEIRALGGGLSAVLGFKFQEFYLVKD